MNATRKVGHGPKARFAEIKSRLESLDYNRDTRKKNRIYLADYLKHRKNTTSEAVAARVAEGTGLLANINDYKTPVFTQSSSDSPTSSSSSASKSTTRKSSSNSNRSSLYEQVDVRGDGNCFYRSLYNAAKEHEDPTILERVFDILGADKSKMASEESGQAALRAAIANYYRTKLNNRDGPYESLKSNYGTRQFAGWIREATRKQASIYKDIQKYAAMKDGKAKFYKDLATVIGTDKEYASDIDYSLISEILENGGVKIVSSTHSPSSPIFDGKPALYIKRLKFDHYNYWRRKSATPTPKKSLVIRSPAKLANSDSSANSDESTNVENEDKRQALMTKLEAQMDGHARCIEKCRKLKADVDSTKAEMLKLGKK